MTFTIDGELYSSKNSRQIFLNKYTGRRYVVKSEAARTDEIELCNKLSNIRERFIDEVKYCGKPLQIQFMIYRQTRRKFDYINIIQNLCDCMVKADLIPDDNADELLPFFLPYKIDRDHPRVELTILNKPVNLFKNFTGANNNVQTMEGKRSSSRSTLPLLELMK
jgi:Holliday junction resolvase RusA-like endonuclease